MTPITTTITFITGVIQSAGSVWMATTCSRTAHIPMVHSLNTPHVFQTAPLSTPDISMTPFMASVKIAENTVSLAKHKLDAQNVKANLWEKAIR